MYSALLMATTPGTAWISCSTFALSPSTVMDRDRFAWMLFSRFSMVSMALISPLLMMTTRSQTALTSERMWELNIIV